MKLIRHEANSENPLTLAGVAALGILATERTDEEIRSGAMKFISSGVINWQVRPIEFSTNLSLFKPKVAPSIIPNE